jgi:hypothetical protein
MTTNGTGWIVIDPVGDKHAGEYFLLTATTNLAAGTDVTIQTWPITVNPVNRSDASGGVAAGFHSRVMEGNAGENVITGVIDSGKFRPEPYFIVMFNDSASVSACTRFNVSIAPEENPTISPSRCFNESGIIKDRNSSGSWIAPDPIPDHILGDTITFSGTTNLAPGEQINIRISEPVVMCPKCREDVDSVNGCCGDFNRTVTVRPGTCDHNLWSLEVNTSDHDFHGDDHYWIGMFGRDNQVENATFFTINSIPKPNLTLNLPETDPDGFALRFSGHSNTGNGMDEKLLLTVSSDSGKKASFMVPVYRNETGYLWNYTVNKSAIIPYNFLTVRVSSQTSPQISIERVFMYTNEPAYYPYDPIGP